MRLIHWFKRFWIRSPQQQAQSISASKYSLDHGGVCTRCKPGEGDCLHFVGLPAVLNEDNTDVYGKPHGWCWYCWLGYRLERANEELYSIDRLFGNRAILDGYKTRLEKIKFLIQLGQTTDPDCGVALRLNRGAPKRMEDMTEPELRTLFNGFGGVIKNRLIINVAGDPQFCLLIFNDPKVAQYISSCARETMVKALRKAADRIEKNEEVRRV